MRSITLVVNIIDPQHNAVVGTEPFDLTFYSKSKKARFRIAINEGYYGFSNTDILVESLHAAQQTLLEAAAVWVLDNAFGQQAELAPCFKTNEEIALGTDKRQLMADQAENIREGKPQIDIVRQVADEQAESEVFVDTFNLKQCYPS